MRKTLRSILFILSLTTLWLSGISQTMIPLPPHSSTYTGYTRGFYFTSPADIVITGLRVVDDANSSADQAVEVLSFPGTPSSGTGTQLGYWTGIPTGTIISTFIPVSTGDVIGILGNKYTSTAGFNAINSYGSVYSSTIAGVPTTLNRFGYQANIAGGASNGNSLITSTSGSIGRVEVYWSYPTTSPNDAGITGIISPAGTYCLGDSTDLIVNLQNFGTDPLDSCMVVWDHNGNLDSAWYTVNLDTLGGTGSADTNLLLTTLTMGSGAQNFTVYPKYPNGVADTVDWNDTSYLSIAGPSLNGTYLVGSSASADYANFTEATDDLVAKGICGPVIFNVEDGNYLEQIEIPSITGASSINTITFTSLNGDSTLVELEYNANSSGDNYTLSLNGAQYVTFDKISIINSSSSSYRRVVNISGSAESNTIQNCVIEAPVATSTSSNYATVYNASGIEPNHTISNNVIKNGSYGLYWYGSNSSTLEEGNVIENNTIENPYYMGIASYYQNAVNISHNKISSGSSYSSGYGMYLYYNDNHIVVDGNHVFPDSTTTNWPYYGMRIYYCDAQFPASSEIKNNRIVLGGTSTSTRYGMYPYYSDFQTYTNNTVIISAGSTSSRALYHYYGDYNTYYNNAYINLADGYAAYYYNSNSILASDNNAWYSTNMSYLGYAGGTVTNLAGFQSGLGMDANSVVADPIVSDTVNALFCADSLNNAGTPSIAMYDYEGEMRSSTTPDIGANEYQSVTDFNVFDDFVICDNSDSTFTLAHNYDYVLWGTALDTATSYTVSQAGQYYVQAISACGTFYDTAQVYAQEQPTLPFNMNICADEVAPISSGITNPAMISWSTGATTDSIDISAAGVYTVETVDTVGCYSIDSVNVTQSPEVDLPATLDICENTTEFLDAQIQGSYDWSTGSTNQTILVDSSGSYSVVVTDQFGCVSTDTTVVTVIELPDTSYTTTTTFLTVEFFSTNQTGVTYVWDFGDGDSATGPNVYHIYDWKGDYTATLTAYNGCDTVITEFPVFPSDTTSVEGIEVYASSLSIYPNPNNGQFNLAFELNGSHEVSYEIFDIQGRLVDNKNLGIVSGTVHEAINIDEAAQGLYLLKVKTGDDVQTFRISKR